MTKASRDDSTSHIAELMSSTSHFPSAGAHHPPVTNPLVWRVR